jgi:hypothetical protein
MKKNIRARKKIDKFSINIINNRKIYKKGIWYGLVFIFTMLSCVDLKNDAFFLNIHVFILQYVPEGKAKETRRKRKSSTSINHRNSKKKKATPLSSSDSDTVETEPQGPAPVIVR